MQDRHLAEADAHPIATLLVPLLGSLLLTGGVVAIACRLPAQPSLTWPILLSLAVGYILIAAATHTIALWAICGILQEQIETPFLALALGLWPSISWLPLLALFVRERSIWTTAVPPLMAIAATLSLKCGQSPARQPPPATSSLFHTEAPPPLLRTLLPAAATSIAAQGGIATLLLGYPLIAGCLFALCTLLPIWAFPQKSRPATLRRTLLFTSVVVALTAIPLTPFLRQGSFAAITSRLLHARPVPIAPKAAPKTLAPGNSFTGVVLILPVKPHEKVVPPAPITHTSFHSGSKPALIPFDGAYWYFKQPDPRPRPDARTVHGDPTKANIRSTDLQPLTMEAHQFLGSPLPLACCTALRVALRNADDRPGAISIEVFLRDTISKSPRQSLGSQILPSSQAAHIVLDRPPVDETLTFPIPPSARRKQFDEITIAIRPSPERSRTGAHIAIQHFELLP